MPGRLKDVEYFSQHKFTVNVFYVFGHFCQLFLKEVHRQLSEAAYFPLLNYWNCYLEIEEVIHTKYFSKILCRADKICHCNNLLSYIFLQIYFINTSKYTKEHNLIFLMQLEKFQSPYSLRLDFTITSRKLSQAQITTYSVPPASEPN